MIKISHLKISGKNLASYRYSFDGNNYTDEKNISKQIFINNLTEGNHTISVKAKNKKEYWSKDDEISVYNWANDYTKPNIIIDKKQGKYEEPIGVNLKGKDGEIIYYTIDGTVPLKGEVNTISLVNNGTVFIKEPTTLQYYAVDQAKNISDIKSLKYILPDMYVPIVKLVTPKNNSILYDTNSTIQLELKDASGIDYNSLKLVIDKIDVSQNINIQNNTISYIPDEPFKDKKIDIYLKVQDNTGNSVEKYYNFTVDSSELTIANSHKSGYYYSPFYFRLVSNRPTKIFYTTDGSTPAKDSINTKIADSPLEDLHIYKTTHLKYFAQDNFNNQTDIKSINMYFDKKAPKIMSTTIKNDDYINSLKPNINIKFTDDLSGVDISRIDFKVNGFSKRNTADINNTNLSYTPLFELNEDINNMELLLVDRVGNSRYFLYNFRLDITKPISTISHKEGLYNQDINLSIKANETAYIYYTIDGAEPIVDENNQLKLPINIEIKENTTLKYIVQDLASNQEIQKEYNYKIDKDKPNNPKNLKALFKDKRVELSWNSVQNDDISGYNIYRKIEGDKYYKINGTLVTKNSYTDTNTTQSLLSYKITSVDNSTNESAYSDEVFGYFTKSST